MRKILFLFAAMALIAFSCVTKSLTTSVPDKFVSVIDGKTVVFDDVKGEIAHAESLGQEFLWFEHEKDNVFRVYSEFKPDACVDLPSEPCPTRFTNDKGKLVIKHRILNVETGEKYYRRYTRDVH